MKISSIYFLASISVAYAAVTPLKISNGSNMSKRSTHKKIEYLPIYNNNEQDEEDVEFKGFNRSLNGTDLSVSENVESNEVAENGEVTENNEVVEDGEVTENSEVIEDSEAAEGDSIQPDFDLSASGDTQNAAVPSPVIAQAKTQSISEINEDTGPILMSTMQAPVAANNDSGQQSDQAEANYKTQVNYKVSDNKVHNTQKPGSKGYVSNSYGSNSYGSNGYVSNSNGSNIYGSNAYGSIGYGSNAYGSNGYGSNGYGSNGYGSNGYGSNGYGSIGFGSIGYGSNSYGSNSYGSNESIFVSFKGKKYGTKERYNPIFYQKLNYKPKNHYGNLFELCYQTYPSFKKSWDTSSKFRINWEVNVNFRNQCISKTLSYNKIAIKA
ncbi:hypothetical protein BB561_000848 [Smittium simulii]|uniref:Uncharacterized protein n=1 Tax=Smittium simulii TaxID=133385 RepID=A0A2T9YXF4_9FUNG|nr:hypothetical protein BB561_000848 [Smittium simulii]